jgi:hypothetical protein
MLVRRSKTEMEGTCQETGRNNQDQQPTKTFTTSFIVVPSLWSPHPPARLHFKTSFSISSPLFSAPRFAIKDPVLGCLNFQYPIGLNGSGNGLQQERLVIVQRSGVVHQIEPRLGQQTSASRQFEPSVAGITVFAAFEPNIVTEAIENERYMACTAHLCPILKSTLAPPT